MAQIKVEHFLSELDDEGVAKETNDELELHGKAAIRDKLMANRTYNEKPESKEI